LIVSAGSFFVEPGAVKGDRASLAGEELRHARSVLRLSKGDEATLLDGAGGIYRARFLGSGRSDGEMEIISCALEPPPPLAITLALALLKGDRFEWALQKACELGAAGFIPLVCERGEARPSRGCAAGEDTRLARWRRIAAAACKQSGRARFPIISPPLPLSGLAPSAFARTVVLWEEEAARPLGAALGEGPLASVLLVVGPEGGFSPREMESLTAGGAVAARLGPRVLRAETAAVAGAALVQYLAGDLSQGGGR
jgi:16S rRNA (uracil1498-N3)-methyltransferase